MLGELALVERAVRRFYRMGWRKANLLRADEEVDSPDRVRIFDRQLKVDRKGFTRVPLF